VAIAVQGGLLSAGCFVLTRELWLPIGFHLGWNFAESGFFGTTVPAPRRRSAALLTGTAHGPVIISGGAFGPEASIFAVPVGGIAALVLLRKAYKRGMFISSRPTPRRSSTNSCRWSPPVRVAPRSAVTRPPNAGSVPPTRAKSSVPTGRRGHTEVFSVPAQNRRIARSITSSSLTT
jgi:hypothetical protein